MLLASIPWRLENRLSRNIMNLSIEVIKLNHPLRNKKYLRDALSNFLIKYLTNRGSVDPKSILKDFRRVKIVVTLSLNSWKWIAESDLTGLISNNSSDSAEMMCIQLLYFLPNEF